MLRSGASVTSVTECNGVTKSNHVTLKRVLQVLQWPKTCFVTLYRKIGVLYIYLFSLFCNVLNVTRV